MRRWLATPPGRYLLTWEQQCMDQAVADLFGFHALQLGLPELDGLRMNRMPHRWRASDEDPGEDGERTRRLGVTLHCDADALPFASASLDLVVLPHTLELAADPHRALREVERVLVPEGRVVVIGFNPLSLWGLRQRVGGWRRRLGSRAPLFLPEAGEMLGYWRLRDWLRLLSFEVEAGRFGCFVPPLRRYRWLSRFEWMEDRGDRWWPVFGAAYMVVAVKRVRGMRLVGLAKRAQVKAGKAPAVVTNKEGLDVE
nr:class I SAM-dependent methyltransferase [Azohydromonas aeria]